MDPRLHWRTPFVPRMFGSFGGLATVLFKPNSNWSDVLTSELIDLFINLHARLRGRPHTRQHTQECLIQLASASPRCFGSSDNSSAYFVHFLSQASAICEAVATEGVSGGEVSGQEVLAMAQMTGRLVTNFGRELFYQVEEQVQAAFLSAGTQLTMLALQRMTEEDNDDPLYTEAFDQCLNVWLTLVGDDMTLGTAWRQAALQVFEQFVLSRLAKAKMDALSEEEVHEEEEADERHYSHQLSGAAILGRQDAAASLGMLHELLQQRLQQVRPSDGSAARRAKSPAVQRSNRHLPSFSSAGALARFLPLTRLPLPAVTWTVGAAVAAPGVGPRRWRSRGPLYPS